MHGMLDHGTGGDWGNPIEIIKQILWKRMDEACLAGTTASK